MLLIVCGWLSDVKCAESWLSDVKCDESGWNKDEKGIKEYLKSEIKKELKMAWKAG